MPEGAHANEKQRSPHQHSSIAVNATFSKNTVCISPSLNQQSPGVNSTDAGAPPASREPNRRHPVSDSCADDSHATELQTSGPSLHQQPNAQAGCLPDKWPHEVPGTVCPACHRKHHRKKRQIRIAGQIRGHAPRVRLQTPCSRFKNRSRSRGGWHREMRSAWSTNHAGSPPIAEGIDRLSAGPVEVGGTGRMTSVGRRGRLLIADRAERC